jgi:hypothetical protein
MRERWFHIWVSPPPIQHEELSFILLIIFLCLFLAVFMPRNQQRLGAAQLEPDKKKIKA